MKLKLLHPTNSPTAITRFPVTGVKQALSNASGCCQSDVGGGYGASIVIMAQAFPNSTFVGFNYHELSITHARTAAANAGVADRVKFEVSKGRSFPGRPWPLAPCHREPV